MLNIKYRITESTRRDLISIGQYTEMRWGAAQRRTIRAKLLDQFQRLADFPGMGLTSGIAHPNSRSFPVHPFTVIYLPERTGVTILRIVHQRQSNIDNDLFASEDE